MNILKTTLDKIAKYRINYLNSLPEFQELFIELMINNSDCYFLQIEDNKIGYTIRNTNSVLIEFYVLSQYIPESNNIFSQVLKDLSITEVYCKSFDALLLSNCLLSSMSYSVLGVLYRDYVKDKTKKDQDLIMEKADLPSRELLISQEGSIRELFETEQQLTYFIQNENVFIFYKNDELIGCGMVLRTNPDWDYCDLGVWVNPLKRRNGFGSQIIIKLREYALKKNMKPSCGCALENLASQRTLEKSGYVSQYKLINFKINKV